MTRDAARDRQVHFAIIMIVLSQNVYPYTFSEASFIQQYVGNVASAAVVAFVLHLVVRSTDYYLTLSRSRGHWHGSTSSSHGDNIIDCHVI